MKTSFEARAEVAPEALALAVTVQEQRDPMLEAIQATDPLDDDFLGGAAKFVKVNLKAFDDARKELNRPFLDAKAAIDAVFDAPLRALKQLDGAVRLKLAEGQRLRLAQAAEARKLAAEAARAGDVQLAVATLQAAPSPAQKPEGITFRTSWKPTVVDAALVPREFWVFDAALATKHAGTGDTPRAIPGVVFEQVLTPVNRT